MARPSIGCNGPGQNLFSNLNLIFELYEILGNNVAPSYFRKIERRTKKTIYQALAPVISRDRSKKIRAGENIEFTKEMEDYFVDYFALNKKYFQQENAKLIVVEGLLEKDWGKFFEVRQNGMKVSKYENKIKDCLNSFVKLEDELKQKKMPALYSIYYRFREGIRLDTEKRIAEVMERLKIISYQDWENLKNIERIKEAEELLLKHYYYTNVLRRHLEYKKNN